MDDLIKKLTNTDFPEMEIFEHKRALRNALLNPENFKPNNFLVSFRRPLALAIPSIVLIAIVGFFILEPRMTEARALKLAKSHPDVQRLITEKGISPTEVKIKNNKAYVLLSCCQADKKNKQKTNLSAPAGEKSGTIELQSLTSAANNSNNRGALVEIDLDQNQVVRIDEFGGDDLTPLTDKEKEQTQKIIELEDLVKQVMPLGAQLEKVESVLPTQLRLIEQNQDVRPVAAPFQEKKADAYFSSDNKKWIIKVNLNQNAVENVKFLPEE